MTRLPIHIDDATTIKDIIFQMSEGNPSAITAMMLIAENSVDDELLLRLMDLEDMNMRGPQIWVGYKDYAGQNIEMFMKAIEDRNQEMVNVVNDAILGHTAVVSGAIINRLVEIDNA